MLYKVKNLIRLHSEKWSAAHQHSPKGVPIDLECRSVQRDVVHCDFIPRKEVIQDQLPLALPCYDFVPLIRLSLVPESEAFRSSQLA
jgi:hypothetical protein